MGALVAGNKAGLIDNDWPWMAGAFVPTDYWQAGLSGRRWFTAHRLCQFNHRISAYAIVAFAMLIGVAAFGSKSAPTGLRVLGIAVGVVAAIQVLLGVGVLLTLVSLPLALMHQVTAAILLATAVAFAWRARRDRVVL